MKQYLRGTFRRNSSVLGAAFEGENDAKNAHAESGENRTGQVAA